MGAICSGPLALCEHDGGREGGNRLSINRFLNTGSYQENNWSLVCIGTEKAEIICEVFLESFFWGTG